MRTVGAFVVFVLCALAQAAVARLVPPLRTVRVDLCLIALVGYALGTDPQRGFVLGVLAGLAADLIGGGQLGVCALGYGVVGLFVGGLQQNLFEGTIVMYGLLVLVSAVVGSLVVYSALRVYGPTHNYLVELLRTLLPSAVATAVVAPFALVWIEQVRHD